VRHTKIVATLGPATDSSRALDALIAAGVDVVRLNFSHGTHETHRVLCERVRDAASRAGRVVAVLQDLGGPKIRTGCLADGRPVTLVAGQRLAIQPGDFAGDAARLATTYAGLPRFVRPGHRLLLDDGRIELQVIRSGPDGIEAEVVHGGTLGEHKGINAPGVQLPDAALTEKDAHDLEVGLAMGVDLVGVSFVRHERDLERARALAARAGRADVALVAKIERPEAVDRLDPILDASDAVMVARGDLGLEVPLEQVPRLQKDLTRRARSRGVPVIVATQVLESMRSEPRPTRAEVSDAANAVGDGVDAIMLAGETAVGAFPVLAVETLDRVIRDAERIPPTDVARREDPAHAHGLAMCRAAVTLAMRAQAAAIVAVTQGGTTARQLSSLRPEVPIIAATDNGRMAAQLGVCRSVSVLVIEATGDASPSLDAIAPRLIDRVGLRVGVPVVFIRIHPDLDNPNANYIKLQRLGDATRAGG
jgi:pyruvate kinase